MSTFPDYTGGLTVDVLDQLYAHYRLAKERGPVPRLRAWVAVMRTYPEVLAAARRGLERSE